MIFISDAELEVSFLITNKFVVYANKFCFLLLDG